MENVTSQAIHHLNGLKSKKLVRIVDFHFAQKWPKIIKKTLESEMQIWKLMGSEHDKQPSGYPSSQCYSLTPYWNNFQGESLFFWKKAFGTKAFPCVNCLGVIIHSYSDSITRNHHTHGKKEPKLIVLPVWLKRNSLNIWRERVWERDAKGGLVLC